MDISFVQRKLDTGEKLKIKYRYPCDALGGSSADHFGVRSDRLVDVSPELDRFYTRFRGSTPIWLSADEVIEIAPDDGVYQEYSQD